MSVEWQVYSNLERKVIARIPTSGEFSRNKPAPDGPISIALGAFAENALQLAASPGFRAIISGPPRPYDQALKPIEQSPIRFTPGSGAPTAGEAAQSVVLVLTGSGHGSGVLISKEGHVLTNEHVVSGAKFVKLRWADGTEALGEVVRSDRRRDVALVETRAQRRTPLPLKTTTVQPGQRVFAIGAPLEMTFQGSVTSGVVSANRTIDGLAYLQSDVTVNPGNSGGPLLDESGAVIGLTSSGILNGGTPTNINLFIPIADALRYLGIQPL